MKTSWTFRGCVLLLAALSAAGCGGHSGRGVEMIGGLDWSGSMRLQEAAGASAVEENAMRLAQLCAEMDEQRDSLKLFRVARTLEQLPLNKPLPAEGMLIELNKTMQQAPAQNGTYAALFWNEAARLAKRASAPVWVILLSDGDNDDQTAAAGQMTQRAARELAQNALVVKVMVIGAKTSNTLRLRRDLSALDEANKLEITSASNADISAIAQAMQAGREAAPLAARAKASSGAARASG